MLIEEIDYLLHMRGVTSWDAAYKEPREAFADAMKDKQYGGEALQDAWCWFYEGWGSKW